MPLWKSQQHGEERVIWTCNCGETQTQLELMDEGHGVTALYIYDLPRGYFYNLWRAIKGYKSCLDIVLNEEDRRTLAEHLMNLKNK